jgi:hypothetical protein
MAGFFYGWALVHCFANAPYEFGPPCTALSATPHPTHGGFFLGGVFGAWLREGTLRIWAAMHRPLGHPTPYPWRFFFAMACALSLNPSPKLGEGL